MKFWTVTDVDGSVYVFNVAFIKAVGRDRNWIAIYSTDDDLRRFEYPKEEDAQAVLDSFLVLVED